MYGLEAKRIVSSRIFIFLMLILFAYYAYVNVNYIKQVHKGIENKKENAETINSYIAEMNFNVTDIESANDLIIKMKTEKNEMVNHYIESGEDMYSIPGKYTESVFEDWNMQEGVISNLERIYVEYPRLMKKTVLHAAQLINDDSQSDYSVRENKKIVEKYNTVREFSPIDNSLSSEWYDFYGIYKYFYIIAAFSFLLLSADVFCSENSRRLEGMVYTAKNGRGKLFATKASVLVLLAFLLTLFLTAVDIGLADYFMGSKLIHEPLQVNDSFMSSPFNLSFIQYIILNNVLRFTVLLFVISLAAAVSQLSRKVFVSAVIDCVIMLIIAAIFIYASGYMAGDGMEIGVTSPEFDMKKYELLTKIRAFLPICLINPREYFENLDYINIFGFPISRLVSCLSVTLLLTFLFTIFAFVRYGSVLKFLPKKEI